MMCAVRRGFTLVELLVTVAVIGFLMAMLMPALASVQRTAQATQCLSGLRQFGIALVVYADDYDGQFPLSTHSPEIGLASQGAWFRSMEPYGVVRELRHCPEDPNAGLPSRWLSYATNDYFEVTVEGTSSGDNRRRWGRLTDVRFAEATAYAGEIADGEGSIDHFHASFVPWTTPADVEAEMAVRRHAGDRMNVIFLDGHAEGLAWTRIESVFGADRDFMHPGKPF
ncbi:MAG: type II secretion system protein [Planctomycetota bacterium]